MASEQEVLEPCPFCSDPMERHFDVIRHINQGDCIIGASAWDWSALHRWNRRLAAAAIPPSGEASEPELTCPHIDAFIAATNPPAEVLEELETIRCINSQLRCGIWHYKALADHRRAAPPAPVAIDEAVASHVLDVAADYILEQYGIGALHHPVDRARIRAALNPQPNGGASWLT